MEQEKNELKTQENIAIQVAEKAEMNEENVENTGVELEEPIPDQTKKSKFGLILVITVILVIMIGLFSTIFALINMGNEKIIKGIKIAQIDVSDMTKEKAKTTLEEIYFPMEENEIHLTYGEFESTTTYKALEVQYKIEEAIEQAYQIGRNGNLLKDNFTILKGWIKGFQIDLDVTIDQEMLQQLTQNINNSI